MLDLYLDCLDSEPKYVPKKFRNDNYQAVSDEEVPIMRRLEFKRFQAEFEILRIRRDDFTEKIMGIDKEFDDIICNQSISEEARVKLRERWKVCLNEDIDRINTKWKKKILSTKKAFNNDKNSLILTDNRHVQNNEKENIRLTDSQIPVSQLDYRFSEDQFSKFHLPDPRHLNADFSDTHFSNTKLKECDTENTTANKESKNGMSQTSPNKNKNQYHLRSSIYQKGD